MMEQLKGTGVALITPFKSDLSVDFQALERLVSHVVEGGVDYLVVLGTTGESATLSTGEKRQVLQAVARCAGGRVPLVAGVGGNNTLAVAGELRETDLGGYCAVLSVSPYYNRPTQEGIYRHFRALSEASPLPLLLYNVPSRTGSNMLPQTVLRLAKDFENIVGIKEASGDLGQIQTLLDSAPEDFLVLSGDDLNAVPVILGGGAGVISVLGQGIPDSFSGMIRLAMEGDRPAAMEWHTRLQPLVDLIFREGNPAGIKGLLEARGICTSAVRLPLVALSGELAEEIRAYLKSPLAVL